MKEMDHEISVDVEVEERTSTSVNIYGHCKNLCSHEKTAKIPGCPCKNASMKCSSSCKCGT